jgi:hypothetical protein
VPAGATGTVTFYSGSTVLGTATIVNGVATLTTTTIPVGTNVITGAYSGNGTFAAATSAAGSVIITQATPLLTAPSASPASAAFGASVTLIQAVPAGATGTVTFYSGSTVLGTATIVNGVATLTTTTIPVGSNVITGAYSGNTNYAAATSAAGTVTILPPSSADFSMNANPSSITIHAGDTGSSVITFTPVGGFTGTVTLNCTTLPANASCQFMQNGTANNTVVMTGNNQPIQVGVNVLTSKAVAQANDPTGGIGSGVPAFALIFPCSLVGLVSLARKRKHLPRLLSLFTLVIIMGGILAGVTGCGAAGFGTTVTPAGTSVVTVHATASAVGTSSTVPKALDLTITIIQ